jgi:hypothetical protein
MKCAWLLANNQQCGATTRFSYVKDDDDNKKRKYLPFCDKHLEEYHAKGPDPDDEYCFYDETLGR